jgi:hypothetical protein
MSEVRTLPTPISLADFDVGVTLGTGSFGRVRFATHKVNAVPSEIWVLLPNLDNCLHILS